MRHRPRAAASGGAASAAMPARASAVDVALAPARRCRSPHASRQCRRARPCAAPSRSRGRSAGPTASRRRRPARARRTARACARRRHRARAPPSTRGRAASAARERVRVGASPRARRRGGRGCCARAAPRRVSPVMNVAKSTMRPLLDARPLAVRAGQHGERTRPRPASTRRGSASPRRASRRACRGDRASTTPGTMRERAAGDVRRGRRRARRATPGTRVRRLDPALAAADHAAGEPRRGVVAPVAEQRARAPSAKSPPLRRCSDAERRARSPTTAPCASIAIRARGRRAPVDARSATRRHVEVPECPDGGDSTVAIAAGQGVSAGRAARSRACGTSARRPRRRSRARRPSARRPACCSFFQNGARVFR